MAYVRQKQASTTHVKQKASSTTLVRLVQSATTFVKKLVSGGFLETIWDGGDTLWDEPEPRTIWDKDLTEGFVKTKQTSTTYVKQKQES